MPFVSIPALRLSLTPSLHPKGFQAPLGSLAEAEAVAGGCAVGCPALIPLFLPRYSLNTVSVKQTDPIGTSCKGLQVGLSQSSFMGAV